MKKLKMLFCNFIIAAVCFSNIVTVHAAGLPDEAPAEEGSAASDLWPDGPEIEAEAAVLMDITTGTVLYEKNPHQQYYPASTTKIMTTLLALENSSLDETVTFSHNAVFSIERDSSHIAVVPDEQLTMEQSLYGIMLESANEVSNGVAEHISGSIESFAELMNQKARELGCQNTNFTNANGLPDENHVTTAYDLALIGRAAMQNETFRNVTSTTTYQIPPTNKQEETRYLSNHHNMLPRKKYAYEGCVGGKTGFTVAARQTLVTFAKRGDLNLVCVIMKAEAPFQWTNTQTLLDWGFDNFQVINISENEKNYDIGNASFFNTNSSVYGNTKEIVDISKDGIIILPTTAAFQDAESSISYDNTAGSSIATLSYTYAGRNVGYTTIDLTNLNIPEFNFISTQTDTKTDASQKQPSRFSLKTTLLIAGVVAIAAVIILGLVYLFKNYHFFRRRRIRRSRRSKRQYNDFHFK